VVDIPNIDDVEPLPNLDYKMMCGDSLISTIHGEQLIPDPTKEQQGMLAVTPIQMAIQPLLELQHRYFDAQTEERHQLRSQILAAEANVFRVAVADRRQYWTNKQRELERNIQTMKGKVSKPQEKERTEISAKLAELDKFAVEVKSGERSLTFFQYHLHFRNVFKDKGGFDVVIGNPPYGAKLMPDSLHDLLAMFPSVSKKTKDSYWFFMLRSFELIHDNAFIALIVPNTWLLINTGKDFRRQILEWNIQDILDYGDGMFESATVETLVCLIKKEKNSKTCRVKRIKNEKVLINQIVDKSYWVNDSFCKIIIDIDDNKYDLIKKIEGTSILFDQICSIIWGIKPYQIGYGNPPQTEEMIKNRIYHSNIKRSNLWKPLLIGKNVARYQIKKPPDNQYILYGENLMYGSKEKAMLNPKIVLRQTSDIIRASYDEDGFYCQNSLFIIYSDVINLKFLLGLLNSKLVNFIYRLKNPQTNKIFAEIKPSVIKEIPIAKNALSNEYPKHQTINNLVDLILSLKDQDTSCDTSSLEAEIDQLIYQLYDLTEEEISIVENSV